MQSFDAIRRRSRGVLPWWAAACLAALLVLPAAAASKVASHFDVRLLLGYVCGISTVTWFLYFSDKKRAERGDWRVSEGALHLAEVLGGWPAAFIAQRMFRHKIRKCSYQIAFWAIVLVHQLTAFEYLTEGPGFRWTVRELRRFGF